MRIAFVNSNSGLLSLLRNVSCRLKLKLDLVAFLLFVKNELTPAFDTSTLKDRGNGDLWWTTYVPMEIQVFILMISFVITLSK